MDKPVTEAFIAFVNAQPATKQIDNSMAWRTCAVGEFAVSRGDPIDGVENDTLRALYQENGARCNARMYDAEQRNQNTMMDMLNVMVYTVTYGELAQMLADKMYD